jgi:DNA primase
MDLRDIIPATPRRKRYANYDVDCCPLHQDSKPSLLIYPGHWVCKAGCGSGDAAEWIARTKGVSRSQALREVGHQPRIFSVPERPKEELPQSLGFKYHLELQEQELQWFISRGLTRETVERYQLGYGTPLGGRFGRFSIPIYEGSALKNVRFRRDDRCPICRSDEWTEEIDKDNHIWWCVACGEEWKHQDHNPAAKYAGIQGMNQARLFNVDCLSPPPKRLFITEGELDCLVLAQNDYAAVSGTSGASAFPLSFAVLILHCPTLYLVMDSDGPGQEGAKKIKEVLPKARNVVLPVKDASEFFLHYNRDDFEALIREVDARAENNLLLGISNGLMH